MNELQNLYNVLQRDGYYTKSFSEFQTQWQDQSYRDKVYSIASRDGLYTKSKDEFLTKYSGAPAAAAPLKKKDSTASASKLAASTSASSTKKIPTETQLANQGTSDYSKYRKIGNEYYDGQGEIFTNYPGKEGKAYRFDNGQWYEYSSSLKGTKGDITQLKNQIKDPMRVAALNKQFQKQGGTEKGVFVGYPGKEQNEYKVNDNGTWQRRSPENKAWVTVTNNNSIIALNNQFKKDIKTISEPTKVSEIKKDNVYQTNFSSNLKSINSKLIGGTEEEAVKALRKKFPSFRFEEINGVGGAGFLDADKIEVTAPNGKKEQFSLDNWSWDEDKAKANEMMGWMEGNNLSPSQQAKLTQVRAKNREEDRYKNPTIGDTTAQIAAKERQEQVVSKELFKVDKKISTESQQFLSQEDRVKQEARQAREAWIPVKSQQVKDIYNKYSEYTADKKGSTLSEHEKVKAQAALGALSQDNETIQNVNRYQDDIKYNAESYKKKSAEAERYIGDLNEKYINGEITQEEYNAEIGVKQKELLDQETEIKNQIKISDQLTKTANQSVAENYLVQEAKGSLGGGLAISSVKGLLSPLRLLTGAAGENMSAAEWHETIKNAISPIWDFDTSLEYLRSEERPDLYKAGFSVAESLGAMAPMALSGGSTLLGTGLLARGTMGAVSFYPMSYYEMKDELENIDMPESDKVAMASIYGVVSSALESIGMEYALGKIDNAMGTAIKRNILKRVLGKTLPKDAPKEFIDAVVRNETKAYVTSLGLGTLGAMAVEGGTEGLQSLTGAGIQEIYDTAKGTEFFNNDGFEGVVKGALYESYLGALGGGMVHSIYVAKDSRTRNKALNSKELGLLMMAAKTEGMSETLMTNLKADMLSGRITSVEAKAIANNFDLVRGNMKQMPENLTPEAQSASLSLMMERDKLDTQIQGKDPNLVKPQSDRVAEINTRLQQISEENAVQEQSTSEVPVQPTTEVSEQVEGRVPKSETQGTSGEVIGEKTQSEQAQGALDEKKKNFIDKEISSFENSITELETILEDESISEAERSVAEETISERKAQLEELNSNPVQYVQNRLEEFPSGPINETYQEFYDVLTAEPTQASVAELSGETGQLLADETGNLFDVNETAQSFEFTQETIPAQLQGVEPVSSSEVTVGRGRNRTTTTKVVFSGQQMIDAGIGRLASEEQAVPEVGTTEATIDIAPQLEIELTGIYEAQQSGKALTPEQQKVVDDNSDAYGQVVSSRTLADEVSALNQLVASQQQGPSFMLKEEGNKNKQQSEERKQRLEEDSTALLLKMQPEMVEGSFDVEEPKTGYTIVDIKENKELTDKVPKQSLKQYVGKKINYLMADLLKVDLNSDVKKMGGVFFPLIDGLYGKIGWASIDMKAAMSILRGAVKSDFSMVYTMDPGAMKSNKVLLSSVFEMMSKSKKSEELFTEMMSYLNSRKLSEKATKALSGVTNYAQFIDAYSSLDVDNRAAIASAILPSESVESKTEIGKMMKAEGITLQALISSNTEQFASDLPTGSLSVVIKFEGLNGEKLTAENIKDAIVTREQQEKEGLPIHENYPIYLRGKIVAILNETSTVWSVSPEYLADLNNKVSGVIKLSENYDVTFDTVDKKGNNVTIEGKVSVTNEFDGGRIIEIKNDKKRVLDTIVLMPDNKVDTKEFIEKNIGKITKQTSKGGKYTTKSTKSSILRSASMSASKAIKITEPTKSRWQQFIERLSKAFPTVEMATSQEEFDAMIDEINSTAVDGKPLLTKNQDIYGAVYKGKVYLNPGLESYNAPIHEFGHIWLNVAKTMKPALYKKGIELIKGSEYLQQIKSSPEYKRVITAMQAQGFSKEEIEEYLENEALATAIGDRGESFVSAAKQRNLENWLNELFEFVKKLTGISNVTAEELQNMSLDEFVKGVVTDILSENQQFKEAEIESFGNELQLMTGPAGLSMRDIISIGRNAGFSDGAIKQVLISQGFKVADITPAMQVQINLTDAMPTAFGNVEGGAQQGIQLFNDVRNELDTFARGTTTTTRAPKMTTAERTARIAELRKQNPTLTEISDSEILKRFPRATQRATTTTTKPTLAEIRAKAKEILTAHPIFQNQKQTIQMELISAFDKALGTRANKAIQAQINAIRNNLKQRKIGAKELQDSKAFLRDFIRKVLPASGGYSQKQINKLLSIVAKANESTIMRDTDKVLAIVEEQRGKMKVSTIREMVAMAIKKAKPALTSTGKRRSAGLDAEGRSYFVAVGAILKAAYKGDQAFLDSVKQELTDAENDGRMTDAINKSLNNQKLTKKEQDLLNKAMAYDTFSNVMDMELEQVSDLFKLMKGARTQSIMNLAANRAARSAYYATLNEEASQQVREQNPELFKEEVDDNGNTVVVPKDKNDLLREKKQIFEAIRNGKIAKGIRELSKTWNFKTIPYITEFFRNYFYHLGTMMNVFDNISKGQTFFTDNVYRPLNRMDEDSKSGYHTQMTVLNDIANSISGITKGYKQIRASLQTGVQGITINGKQELFNADSLLRIYALSKNSVQREILERQGFTDSVMDEIKNILGPQNVEFADKVVEYLSNEYYESVNGVYSTVNDVNLGYVDNYFPTSKVKSEGPKFDPQDADFYGIFNAETAPSLYERTDKKSDIDLNLDFTDVLENHFQNMERYKAHAEGVKTLNAIFQNPDVVAMLDATQTKMIVKNAINLAITPNFGAKSKQTFLGKLQTKMTGFALAFKAVQILKQSTSFIQAFEDYSFFDKNTKVPGIISRPLDYLGFMVDSAVVLATLPKQVKQAYGMSANVRDRLEKGIQGDVYGLESGTRLFRPIDKRNDAWGRARRALKTGAAAPTIIGDVLGVMGYMVNYNRNIKNGMTQEEALEAFNNYNATLQTRRSTEKSSIQMSNNELIRAFTMFGSTSFLQMNKVAQAYNNIMNSLGNKKMPAKNDVRALLINLGAANALFVLASNLAKFIKGDDEDRDEAIRQMKRAMLGLNLIENIPLLDTGIKSAINYYDGDERKQEREVTNPFMTLWFKMKQGIKGEDTFKTVQPLIEMVLGAQLDPAISIYNGVGEGEFNDDDIYTILGISKSYRPGAKTSEGEEKKDKEMSKEDMKRYFPDLYEDTYGEGGSMYEAEQAEREQNKIEREAKQAEKDALYGYEEPAKEKKKKSSSRFGSGSKFGSGSRFGKNND